MSDSLSACRERVPIAALWGRLSLAGAEAVSALAAGGAVKIRSPFREDRNPSFSVWMDADGHGFWKDHGTGDAGDDLDLIVEARGCSKKEAIEIWCGFAGVEFGRGGGAGKGRGGAGKVIKFAKKEEPVKPVRRLSDKLAALPEPVKKAKAPEGVRSEIVAVYSYEDESGELAHETVRFEPKGFRQRRPGGDGEGEWVWSLKDARVFPYRLGRLMNAPKCEPIFLVEGEKDVENLEELGEVVIATTLPMGAGKWREEYGKYFSGRWVVVVADFDKPGLDGAEDVARELFEIADRVGILELDDLWKGAKPGDDVSDWRKVCDEIDLPVEDQLMELMAAAERADLSGVDLFDGVVYKGSRGMSVLEDKLARGLVKREGLVFCGDDFWKWNGGIGIWEKKKEKTWMDRRVRRVLRDQPLGEEVITRSRVSSVVSLARSERVVFPEQLNGYPEGCFPVKNGLLELETGKLYPHRHKHLTTVQTPHVYDPGAECPEWLKWLEERQEDEATRAQIQEIFGYCLGTSVNFHSFFFFYGEGGTGKSTCVDVLEWLVGEDNKVSLELTELDNPFTRSQLVGKSLYLAKELTTRSFKHIGLIKAIVSGDPISVDVKFGTGFDFRPKGRLVMESNVVAMTPDSSGGFERRFIQVNWDKPIDRSKMEYGFQSKFKAEMSGILNWALEGYQRLVARGRFEHTDKSLKATEELMRHRASVTMFLKAGWIEDEGPESASSIWLGDLMDLYLQWCEQVNVVSIYEGKKAHFARELFGKRPEWGTVERKKRRYNNGLRDQLILGVRAKVSLDEEEDESDLKE